MATARRKFTVPPFVIQNIDTLQDMRGEKGLSRHNIANITGILYQCILQYENGYSYPNKENYNKLAKYFGWEEWD